MCVLSDSYVCFTSLSCVHIAAAVCLMCALSFFTSCTLYLACTSRVAAVCPVNGPYVEHMLCVLNMC